MLFSEIVYGPIHSRRLGNSLGMNLSPINQKYCTFECIYCECGWEKDKQLSKKHLLPTREEVKIALENKLQFSQDIDSITFSGNGEPTLHPEFQGIIEDTCKLRDRYCPKAQISVLSNSTMLQSAEVRKALFMIDNRILKLDSALDSTIKLIDMPVDKSLNADKIIKLLSLFEGDFTLQTCFLKGEYNGNQIDNTTTEELDAWYKAVDYLRPKQIMIYCIDRRTPADKLEKIDPKKMDNIAQTLRAKGFEVIVSY